MEDGVFVHQFECGSWDNFIYLIGDKASRSCAVVDPAWDVEMILDEANKLDVKIDHVLCTHSHFDHVNRVEALLKTHDIPVHMMGEEIEFSDFKSENLTSHRPGDVLQIGKHTEVTMMHTPGHTPGSTSYKVHDSIVSGDTMFIEGCGRCDLVGGDPETMFQTLKSLTEKLPGNTKLYPGHNYGSVLVSTLDHELKENPYLQHATLEDFVAHRMKGRKPNTQLPPDPSPE